MSRFKVYPDNQDYLNEDNVYRTIIFLETQFRQEYFQVLFKFRLVPASWSINPRLAALLGYAFGTQYQTSAVHFIHVV